MMNRILLIFLLGIYFQPLNAQTSKDIRAEANKLLRESRRLRVDGAYQASNIKLQKAIQLYQSLEMWGKFCTAKSLLAQNYELQGQQSRVEAIQEEIVLKSVKHLGKNNRFELQAYIKLGDLNYLKGDFSAALRYLGEAESVVKRKPAGNEDLKTEIYTLKATTLAASGQLNSALKSFQLAQQSANKKPLPELSVLARFYYGYAKALLESNQLEAASEQAQKSQALHQNLYAPNQPQSINSQLLWIDILMAKKENAKALTVADQLLAGLANQAIKGNIEAGLRKAKLHLQMQQLTAARAAIEKALDQALRAFENKPILLANCYRVQAEILAAQENWTAANSTFEKALQALYPLKEEPKNCNGELIIDPVLLLGIMVEVQQLRYQQALKTQQSADWQQAINTSSHLGCINEQLSFQLYSKKEQQSIADLQRQLAELNIVHIYKKYEQQKDVELLKKILAWIDYAKHWERRELLTFDSENWMKYTLSDSLWMTQMSLQKKWSILKNNIIRSSTVPDNELSEKWLMINQAQENWKQQVKEQYPTYYQYFCTYSDFNYADYIRKMGVGQAHLSCFQVQDQLFVLLADKERLQVLKTPVRELQPHIEIWRAALLDARQATEASQLAQKIYSSLLSKWNLPEEEYALLYISTDQVLDGLPFEALQTADSKYFIEFFPIQYLHQPSELLKSPTSQAKDLLFINSSYASKPAKGDALTWYEEASKWSNLRTSNKYRRFFQGDYWLNYQVTADHLKTEEVANYSIVHIALYHAIANDPSSENAWLMNYESDTATLLFSILDMMNMNLKAGLLTLAMGNGDTTDLQKVRQVATALRFAGAEAILWPRWEVEEAYNRLLIHTYYKKLAEGLSKAEALQQAQLFLLKKRRYKSPHYWANLRLEGVNATIQLQSKFRFPWLFVGVGVGIMVLIIGAWARWGRG